MLFSTSIASRPILHKCFIIKFSSFLSSSCYTSSAAAVQPFLPTPNFDEYDSKQLASSFKDWFRTREDALLNRIFEILAATATTTKEDDDDLPVSARTSELELSQLGLRLNEMFVLRVLKSGKDVLSCLKFFDWAGRQPGFYHTRATFHAIFKILSKQKLMSVMLDFLESYRMQKMSHRVRFYDTLVAGYAVAGKPGIALKLFGAMRFQGFDLGPFAYHVFLNALVEQSCFDVVEVVLKQIKLRGLENEVTSCIRVKNYCKQNKLSEAVFYLRRLQSKGDVINDHMVGILVDAHCKKNKFKEAHRLMEDFWGLRKFSLGNTYGIWIRNLVQAGKLDGAMDFLQSKKLMEGYVPEVFRYNVLVCRLLRENRLDDVCDLLVEMMEGRISPDKVTMNAAMCFFCKAGMVDVALDLYHSRSDFGLSLNSLAYNYLINTLCGDGSVDEAYRVLLDSIKQGYFPGKRTTCILADALCREGKLDKMKELVLMSLELNIMQSEALSVKFISALCKARRVEDGYCIHGQLKRHDKVSYRYTYLDLIHGFNRANRRDMSSRLLIEMQENGHRPTRKMYRAVICCICTMVNPENCFFKLLEMQLSRQEPACKLFNFFIDGAGHAKRPDLAREVFEMMARNGIEHNSDTKIFMMQSYLKGERIADALNFYNDLCKKSKKGNPGRKLNNTMVVGLSKANRPDLALEVLRDLREKGLLPSLESYEELVRSFCTVENYDMVVEVVDDLLKTGRKVSSFIGNTLLLHSVRSRELYQAWVQSGNVTTEAFPSGDFTLGELIGLFSGVYEVNEQLEDLDEVIEQCFPLDNFTYNTLLRRLSMTNRLDSFVELFNKMRKKGYQPDSYTYNIVVQSLCKHGRRNEAMRWVEEIHRMGFELTKHTEQLM
ncbi:hypothetical protein IFM89_026897 [Coptis chinensis]|uniref:Pentatricopeptide repeat-containing protein n=1 Tax=Coptis chinensis TaxID=261450 RepID=A0A835J0P8_9MAGN|nr:hypothetical protein IFM89_026897 [Coptis chinensis]